MGRMDDLRAADAALLNHEGTRNDQQVNSRKLISPVSRHKSTHLSAGTIDNRESGIGLGYRLMVIESNEARIKI